MFTAKQNTASPNKTASIAGSNFIQPKLAIGKSNDTYEVEADVMADKVVARQKENSTSFIAPATAIQKKEEVKEHIQEKPLAETISPVVQLKPATAENKEEETIQKKDDEIQRAVEKQPNDTILGNEPIINDAHNEVVQQKADEELNEEEVEIEEDQEIQKKTQGLPTDEAANIEQNLNNSRGKGSAMDSNTKSEMESGFGADFSGVSIHTDSNAVQMSQQLGAQAFTSGNDIYFNEGKYNPQAESGKHLLAHELTHTIQQGASGTVQNKLIQKTDEDDSATPTLPSGVSSATENNGVFNFTLDGLSYRFSNPNVLELPLISIPNFKRRNSSLYTTPITKRPQGPRTTNQRDVWRNGITPTITPLVNAKIQEAVATGGFNDQPGPNKIYFFKGTVDENFLVFGTQAQLTEMAINPNWDANNAPTSFQVDHILEYQLMGDDLMSNFELLEASANASSGSSLMWEINRRIKEGYDVLVHNYYQNNPNIATRPNVPLSRPSRGNQYANLLGSYQITFANVDYNLDTRSGRPDSYWSYGKGNAQTDIDLGAHLNKITPLTGAEVEDLGQEDAPALYNLPSGGQRIDVGATASYPVQIYERTFLKQAPDFVAKTMEVEAYKSRQRDRMDSVDAAYPDMTWALKQIEGTYIFCVDEEQAKTRTMQGAFQSINLPGMSPIEIHDLSLNANGFLGFGKVLPTVPLIGDADIDIVIDGEGIRMRKLFTSDEFDFPSPFVIEQASLEVFFGTDGLGLSGRIDFGIQNVGTGFVGAAVSLGNGFALEGEFNFDSELFDPAQINFEYKDNVWTIGGEIGIPEGKIQGVKSATITASYSENTLTASGEAELDVPGIERGTMNVVYGDDGFSIGGTFQLKSDIPGIRGGSVSATISKQEGEESYNIMVSGTAQPDIPGINSELTITYDNGALTIEGSAEYSRGMLSGRVEIGATNRAIGDDGQPSGEPDDAMRVYGGGSLTLTLTPWLQATAGVRFLPNGEIEVNGRIGLPDTVNVFDRKSIDRNLFSMPALEIPIFAIPLGPRSLGIVARITGGLDFSAGFGPGQIRSLYADVTYNPDREDETTISGHGEFAIPADAGLTLHGDLGLGLSIGIASLTGGIEVAGELGLEGEALAQVDVNWSPQTGLEMDALGRITVNPKFTFDINAFARASLDLWLVSFSETWRYNLASFSWGPDIQFGIVFPIHYKEDEPFDISFDDIEVIYPELDIGNMLSNIAKEKKDEMFE